MPDIPREPPDAERMAESSTSSDTSPKSARRPRRRRGSAETGAAPARRGRFAAGLALILAILATLVSGYVGYLVNSKRGLTDAKGRLVNVEQETAELATLTEQLSADITSLRESQATLTGAVKALHDDIGRGRRAWLLAETENLLIIAQHRLAYARDARLALEALRAADQQLAQLGDPDFQPVRKQLANEIAALEAYAKNDIAGLAQRLARLANGVDALALAPPPRLAAGEPLAETDFLHEVWRDLKDLVRVRHTGEVRRPLLLPEQKYFLRENLRPMLYGAHLALLHGDHRNFELNARSARQWLHDYYDPQSDAVQQALSEIETALRTHAVSLPDLTRSLVLLHERHSRQSGP
jgi:uncharacterized protein HemX